MKLDTSSYYPKSPLDDEEDFENSENYESSESSENCENYEHYEHYENCENSQDSQNSEHSQQADHAVSIAATAISWVFGPLLMPVYAIILIFGLSILYFVPTSAKVWFTLFVFGLNVLLPGVLVLALKRFGVVSDIGVNNRTERFIPYLITLLCLAGTAWLLYSKAFPDWAVKFYIGAAVATLVVMLINFRWKISAHATAVAGLVALLLRLSHQPYVMPQEQTWLIIAIAVAGLTGSARLWLNRHTLTQVLAGYAVGFCAVYFI